MKAVFFDIDDTLYDQLEPFKNACQEVFGSQYEFNVQELFKSSRRYSDEVFQDAGNGIISMDEMYIYRMKKAFEDIGINITDRDALHFQHIYERKQRNLFLTATMRKILEVCGSRFLLGVISNGPSLHQWDKVRQLCLEKYIPKENIFISEDLGIAKPDSAIFHYAAKRCKIKEKDCVYIGDNYINDIAGAKEAGWQTIWLNRRDHPLPKGQRAKETVFTEEDLYFRILSWTGGADGQRENASGSTLSGKGKNGQL